MLAIIGGSGLYHLTNFKRLRRQVVRTPYGETSSPLNFGHFEGGKECVFLARHGHAHTLAPHNINYRANLWALNEVGVTQVYSMSTVAGIEEQCLTGSLVVPDQIIDYTWGRANSFFDNIQQPVFHADMTQPYSVLLREKLIDTITSLNASVIATGIYGCVQGPRLETVAEVRRYHNDGCSILGMTVMPEAALARELNLDFASLCLVTHRAAGLDASLTSVNKDQIEGTMQENLPKIGKILQALT